MTRTEAIDLLKIGIPLLFGSGIVTAVIAWLRSPKVHIAARVGRTVRTTRESDEDLIDLVLEERRIPRVFGEVEWWNAGFRAAKDLQIEIKAPAAITQWELRPATGNLGTSWTCVKDPSAEGANRWVIAFEQKMLAPDARCHLRLGFDLRTGTKDLEITAMLGDQRLKVANAGEPSIFGPLLLMTAISCLALGLLALALPQLSGADRVRALLSALVGSMLLLGLLVARYLQSLGIRRRKPSWEA